MRYKGYNIGKVSRHLWGGSVDKFYWNVNDGHNNVHFDTLREAKEYVNNKLKEGKV